MKLNFNSINIINDNEVIYEGGEDVTSVAVIISGTVKKSYEQGVTSYQKGQFIATDDLQVKFYSGDYIACDNCCIVPFSCASINDFLDSVNKNRDIFIENNINLTNLLVQAAKQYNMLLKNVSRLYQCAYTVYEQYVEISRQNNLEYTDVFDLIEPSNFELTDKPSSIEFDILYTKIKEIYVGFDDLEFYLQTLVNYIISADQPCLFSLLSDLADHVSISFIKSVKNIFSSLNDNVRKLDEDFHSMNNVLLNIDYNKIRIFFNMTESLSELGDINPHHITDNGDNGSTSTADSAVVNPIYKDLFKKLAIYAGYTQEEASVFYTRIQKFKKLKDTLSTDDTVRQLRKELNSEFYKLYERVLLTYVEGRVEDPCVDIFLNFGVADETLLRPETLNSIADLSPVSLGNPCMIWYMKDWLVAIYDGDEIPSKNEFDEEYVDYVRKKKKEEHLTNDKEARLLEDGKTKVMYEIRNMFKYVHRLLNGSPTTFCAALNDAAVDLDFSSMYVSPNKFNEAISKLLTIDFSAFYRESMYENLKGGINKEIIQKEIFPNVIIFPTFGNSGIMWQDISGKRINNPGRFAFPAFFYGDIDLAITKLVARFRWELCKSSQGLAWNDITVPSLTSYYCDYIQFYRKNRDLPAEKKEALKNEIARCRNNIRDVYVVDYCTWIKYESSGALRLNKIARRILFTFCPFSRPIREKMKGQPLFEEAMLQFIHTRQKKIKDLKNHFTVYSNRGVKLTDELMVTLDFYENN